MYRITSTIFALSLMSFAHAQRQRIECEQHFNIPQPSAFHKVGSLAGAALKNKGNVNVPVILVQFADLKFTAADTDQGLRDYYQQFHNAGPGIKPCGSYSSIKEYFRTQSSDQFVPNFDIIGPVTLSRGYAYYGEDSGSMKDIRISSFYTEACTIAINSFDIDWTKYDNDNNGTVDQVFFIYAGIGQNESSTTDKNYIWPKDGTTSLSVSTEQYGTIRFASYGCCNELYGGKPDGIGTEIHELSHALGLPDFYDNGSSMNFGLDYFSIMDAGYYQLDSKMPCGMTAYELDFLQWRKLEELETDKPYSLTLQPTATGGKAYKVINPTYPNEYLILENRQNIGNDKYLGWDIYDPQTLKFNHGLVITHVDFYQNAWNSNSVNSTYGKPRITIVPADGKLTSYYGVDFKVWAESFHNDFYPNENNVTEISSYSLYHNGPLTQTITNIREHADGTVTLDINGGVPQVITIDDITNLIAEYLSDGSTVTINDITNLIDRYLSSGE